jgi:imidazolonepropionase-like amidohydrolase
MRFSALPALLAVAGIAFAQTELSKETQQYVKVQAPTIVLLHVNVIDGSGAPAVADESVVIANGKIAGVSKSVPLDAMKGARVLDMTGYSIFPGIVGMHDHMYYPTPGPGPAMYGEHAFSFPKLYLAAGVTTIRTTGSTEPYTDLNLKQQIDSGKAPGPRMHVTAPYLEGAGTYTPQMHELRDAEDARNTVNYWADEGATNFKAYMHITPDELAAAIDAAHKRHLKITGHLCSIGFNHAAALGIDDLEHGLVVDAEFYSAAKPGECVDARAAAAELTKMEISGPEIMNLIRDLVGHHVAVTSTLPVFEGFVPGRPEIQPRFMEALCEQSRVQYLASRARVDENAAKSPWSVLFQKEMQFERAFATAGGTLLAGLDPTGNGAVIAGYGDQREIELLVEAGFTPLEAIHIATQNGADYLGIGEQLGTIAAGKTADLVLVKGDPSTKISDIENVEVVFKDGVGYDPKKLTDAVRGWVGIR